MTRSPLSRMHLQEPVGAGVGSILGKTLAHTQEPKNKGGQKEARGRAPRKTDEGNNNGERKGDEGSKL